MVGGMGLADQLPPDWTKWWWVALVSVHGRPLPALHEETGRRFPLTPAKQFRVLVKSRTAPSSWAVGLRVWLLAAARPRLGGCLSQGEGEVVHSRDSGLVDYSQSGGD